MDKAALQALYDANKDKEQGSYTDESYQAFKEALQNAQKVLADANATQSAVDAAKAALQNALDGLVKITDDTPSTEDPSHGNSSGDKPSGGDQPSSGDEPSDGSSEENNGQTSNDQDDTPATGSGSIVPIAAAVLLALSISGLLLTKRRRESN